VAFGSTAYAKDKSSTYQLGTYITSSAVADGTITDNFDCGTRTLGSTVCSGGVYANQVIVYRVQVADGVWFLETEREANDSSARNVLGDQPFHFKGEKQNPLDLLKNGDRVIFRVETHKKLFGVDTDIFIPFADNPTKEAKFVGTFAPATVPVKPSPQSDNVRAMCDSHKLSPELEKQFCTQPAVPVASAYAGTASFPDLQAVAKNTEAEKASPAAAAALADGGHVMTPEETAAQIQLGQASKCAVVTDPPGAEVYIDGNKAGVSPMVVVLRRKGDTARVITIKMSGYNTVVKRVFPDGKIIPIGLTLEPN
jgi:hypothetical protein